MKTLSTRHLLWTTIVAAIVGSGAGVAGAMVPPVHLMAEAGAIKTWTTGETLTASDLNAAFSHIHSLMVGGHGGRLVDADVNSSANISYSKVQNGRGIARSWGYTLDDCTTLDCDLEESLNVASIAWVSTGLATVTFNYTATDNVYAVVVGVENQACFCEVGTRTTTTVQIQCYDRLDVVTAPTALDCSFNFVVYDAD